MNGSNATRGNFLFSYQRRFTEDAEIPELVDVPREL
jgi:hypothetical protein